MHANIHVLSKNKIVDGAGTCICIWKKQKQIKDQSLSFIPFQKRH